MPTQYPPLLTNHVQPDAPRLRQILVPLVGLLSVSFFVPVWSLATDPPASQALPRQHAEESFQELSRHERPPSQLPSDALQRNTRNGAGLSGHSPEEYLRGMGEGDLSKGRLACQRVAELAARTDLAKQIRVRVTEHAVDRLRERTGRTTEQDIEVVREEMVNELLRDVRIVDKRIDEAAGICSSIAVMPKSRITSDNAPDPHGQTTPPAFPAQ